MRILYITKESIFESDPKQFQTIVWKI